jgi:dTDP-4-amino-4,6-dideoxygalactose transaminase
VSDVQADLDVIPIAKPVIGKAEEDAVLEVLRSGHLSLGPRVPEFERRFAEFVGARCASAVSSGTTALHLALRAVGVKDGDEVVTSPFSFVATANAAVYERATPVFADIDPVTLNLDTAEVADRITARTKAIMPVHLFGRPAPIAELQELGLPLIEDSAQAFGAGGIASSIASTFSFFPTKNLFCLGDGGLIAVNDDELGERIRMLRFHGSKSKKTFEYIGYNSRLDALQASMLRIFLPHLDGWNRARREAAALYGELGLGEVAELPLDEPGHVYHMYCVRSPERDRLSEALHAAGIAHAVYYQPPLHLQPALAYLGHKEGDFPETEKASRENLCLPLWAGISPEQQEQVVATVRAAATVSVQA